MNAYNPINGYPEMPLDPQLFAPAFGYAPNTATTAAPPGNQCTFVQYGEEPVAKKPAAREGYYINKYGVEMKKGKPAQQRYEFGLHQAFVTEDELRRIRNYYDLIPSKTFLNPSAGTKQIKVATQRSQAIMVDCKNVRLSNAEFSALVTLRTNTGGFVPAKSKRSVGRSQPRKRAWVDQAVWEAANEKADARFVANQRKAIEKALARRNGGN